ncbi:MAG: phage terminase large subunit [Bacilli bacterium]
MSLKIGEKIEIKKPQEKATTMSQTFFDIVAVLKSNKVRETDKLQWCQSLLAILENYYKEDELKSVQNAKKYAIPVLHTLTEKSSVENMSNFFDYYKKLYCFCSRRDFECFIDYMEFSQPKKVLANRREVLKPYVDALNRCAFDPKLQYVITSYSPSLGKSYIATLFSAWAFGMNIDNSIIRISYSDELVMGFSRTIKGIICSPEFAEIFPLFKLYNGKPFEVERESDWKIKNSHAPSANHIARSRGGALTGNRATFAMIFDDITKGAEEANSESVHRGIYEKWTTEWWNRRDSERCKFIFVGTQWCPEDILNRIIEDRNKVSPLLPTDNKYVMESEDHSTIVIRVPMLDENHRTTCPEVYPQEIAEQVEENTDPFLFSCVYQQDPLPVTGREFAWEKLRTYMNLPNDLQNYCMASLDTARKGKDNVSMPILKSDGNGNYYFVDCIFKQKPMEDLYDEIIEKIIEHKIIKLVIENNIDTSLKTLLTDRLKAKGIYWCEIIEKYNTVKKEERIKNNRGIVQKFVVFLDKTLTKPNSDYGRFMENMTKYSFDKPNVHDDSVDSICMFASEIILGKSILPKAKPFKRTF